MYVELHCHSAYSFLDGASLPEELVAAAAQLGYRALALTDHNGVFGSMEHAQAASALGPAGDPRGGGGRRGRRRRPRATSRCWWRTRSGWRNLCRLLTLAHAHTRPDASRRILLPPSVPLEACCGHAEGLVCLSGCARDGVRDEPTMRRLLDAFGPDGLPRGAAAAVRRATTARCNRGLASLAARLGVPCVATGNVHAHARERAPLQDAFVAIR